MKKIILLLAVVIGGGVWAQTNAQLGSTPPPQRTEISSKEADFDLNIHRAIYYGQVLVVDPKVKLQCEWLELDLPSAGAHLKNVNATTNVVIDFTDENGQTHHVTADKAVYAYSLVKGITNELVIFTGNPKVESPESTILSEPLIWDRAANKFHFHNQIMKFRQNLNGGGAGSNTPSLKLF